MYQNVKLEKGMYHLTGKSFLQVLEELDPAAQYADTPLAGLDAYERQLKRFDIHVCGPQCDRVEKFFTTTESAVLFPEFVRRAVRQGIESSVLSSITAVETKSESSQYLACVLTDTASYSTAIAQQSALTGSSILESDTALTLSKYGRAVKASYEAIRRQRLDVFAVILRAIGVKLAGAILKQAVSVLTSGAGSTTAKAGSALAYSDLAALCGKFSNFNMNALIASPSVMASIVAMEQMMETASEQPGQIRLPFGAMLYKAAQLDDQTIIGLDRDFALEMITATDLILETDKLIESQMDLIAVSIQVGFRTLTSDAVHLLTL